MVLPAVPDLGGGGSIGACLSFGKFSHPLIIPRVVEVDLEGSIEARTEALSSLRELGPPDLVHLTRQSTKSAGKFTGVYHHVTGIDASSSASLAAYINTLTQTLQDKTTKIVTGLYCCYNAFSRLDMRVDVKIPGGVESYCIDERGDKRETSDSLWLETFLCGILRAYAYADDGTGDMIKRIVAVRRFNPIASTEMEHRFLEASERLFFKGWQLGSDPEVQVPNMVSNHLTSGLLKYGETTGRYASLQNLFEKLRERDPEVSSLLAHVFLAGDEEVKAISLLRRAVDELPMDYSILDCQASFLQKKGNLEWAIPLAQRAVIAAPSEFGTWARLAEIYVGLERWDLALLTLNSCPMFTYQDKDAPRMPEARNYVLPLLPDTALDEIDESLDRSEVEMAHPNLRKLVAATYKGTFLKAYSLLTEITSKIGWDQLLKIRSQVFVMEEEYRSEKGPAAKVQETPANASSTAVHTASPKLNGEDSKSVSEEDSENEQEFKEAKHGATDSSLERPESTVASQEVKAGNEDVDPTHSNYTHFQHKRLCERWLDNLFMVLYEDLRIYTIWRTDMARAKQSEPQSPNSGSKDQSVFTKSAEEWEILGDLAERLHHRPEAVEAYQACLRVRFSPKAMRTVSQMWMEERRSDNVLQGLLRLIAWQYRWYSEFSPDLFRMLRKVIEEDGAVKARSIVQATTLPQSVLDLTHHYVELCANFRSSGSEV